MPRVSVIVPNYNYETYLSLRIDSILNQTFQDFEIIILDDDSIDNSKKNIEKYRNCPKVSHIVYNEVNSGSPFIQWNKGIELSVGEWIWIAEADDWADVNFLDSMITNVKKDPNIVLSYCQSYRMDADGNTTGDWSDWTQDLDEALFNTNFVLDGREYIEKFLSKRNTIPNASGAIFKRTAFIAVGKANENLKFCADWLLWLKLLSHGNIAFNSSTLNYFRFHPKSVIATSGNNEENIFIFKYDILLRKMFITFLKERNNLNEIKIKNQRLIEMFKRILSYECDYEAKYLKENGLIKESRYYKFEAFKYSNNKPIFLFHFLLIDFLSPYLKIRLKSIFMHSSLN